MESNNTLFYYGRMIFILLLLQMTNGLMPMKANAQTWDEMFNQRKTQRKYLVKQIALLKLYLGYARQGYEIASKGLTTISNMKNGDFNLHRDFFGSLKQVNPHLANSAKVADIIAFQVNVIQGMRAVNNFCSNNPHLSPEEVRYVAAVYANMLLLTDASISELLNMIRPKDTSKAYQLKDDERLMRIDRLYSEMVDQQSFVTAFDRDVRLIVAEREREAREVESLRKQYNTI
ncbi:MAG: hypothetical protein KF763_15420 [Cyclobacteriaceae bacterium]|nr:hypothetical protein [Cyclobacteriaceae bacterium]